MHCFAGFVDTRDDARLVQKEPHKFDMHPDRLRRSASMQPGRSGCLLVNTGERQTCLVSALCVVGSVDGWM